MAPAGQMTKSKMLAILLKTPFPPGTKSPCQGTQPCITLCPPTLHLRLFQRLRHDASRIAEPAGHTCISPTLFLFKRLFLSYTLVSKGI